MDSSGKRVASITDSNVIPIDFLSGGVEFKMEIVNRYGQLVGDFSKLDDQLWLTSPVDEQGLTFCSEGLEWKIVPSHSDEHITDPQSSEDVDNSRNDRAMTSLEKNVSSGCSQNHPHTFSPVSVLRRRSFSNETMKRARSKHRHPAKGGSRFVVNDTTDSCPEDLVRTRKITDLLQLNSSKKKSKSDHKTTQQRKPETDLLKKCVHCGSAKTPQWRNGPEGRKTLCNACGLQYKKALRSGSDPPLATVKPQMQVVKKCVHCESVTTPQWRDGPKGPKTLCNACGLQYRKTLPSEYNLPLRTVKPPMQVAKQCVTCVRCKSVMTVQWKEGPGDPVTECNTCGLEYKKAVPFECNLPLRTEEAQMQVVKKYVHCESVTTPQWRNEPEGSKTLCNACGLQFKKALPSEYHPPLTTVEPPIQVVKICVGCKSATTSQWTDGPEGPETLCNACGIEYKKTLPSEYNLPLTTEEPQMQVVKKCVRCESVTTPQWRNGPEGPKTLCNACGLQYKKALPPGYSTPLTAVEPDMQVVKKCVRCESVTTPQWRNGPEVPKRLCNACDLQFKKVLPSEYRPPLIAVEPSIQVAKICVVCKSATTLQWTEGPEGPETLCNACGIQYKKVLHSEYIPPLRTEEPQTQVIKKCMRCQSVTTPQWRNGPEGRKTLCNACGLQYKKTFPSECNIPLTTVEPPIQVVKKCVRCESVTTPQWRNGPDGPKTLCNACGLQFKKALPSEHHPLLKTVQLQMPVVKNCVACNSATTSQWTDGPEGSNTLCTSCSIKYKKTLPSEYKLPLRTLEPEIQVVKKCVRCESIMTPQWRNGPDGPKTLCNACGLQYKKSLPSEDNLPLSTVEPSMQVAKKCARCESVMTPQWRDRPEGRKTLCNACGLQDKKSLPSENNLPLRTVKPEMEVAKTCVDSKSAAIPQCTDGPEGTDNLGNACGVQNKTALPSECYIALSAVKPQREVVKKCVHCETSITPQWRDGPEGRKTLCNACGLQYKKGCPMRTPRSDSYTKKDKKLKMTENNDIGAKTSQEMTLSGSIADMIGSDSDSDFEPIPRKKLQKVDNKKCTHCETSMTPQWREGPMGRKTLCNACGVQYRHGRLFPEYRPLQSPSYDPSLHSHLPKRVEEMRKIKFSKEHATTGNGEQPS